MNKMDENLNQEPLESEDNIEESNDDLDYEDDVDDSKHIIEYFENDSGNAEPVKIETLVTLYSLTQVDRDLAEIDDEKGDLPFRIQTIKNKISEIEKYLNDDKTKLTNFESEEKVHIKENKSLEDKISKYEDNKYKVKSNKEYDEISKQIELMMETIEKNESRMKELRTYQEDLVKNILEMNRKYDELKADLKEDTAQLTSLNKQFEEEEYELNEKRKILLKQLSDEYRRLYERINGSLKGEAIAIIRKGNCSGCYNSVPPQREIEIRMAKDIYLCQSCGRILIDESLISNQ